MMTGCSIDRRCGVRVGISHQPFTRFIWYICLPLYDFVFFFPLAVFCFLSCLGASPCPLSFFFIFFYRLLFPSHLSSLFTSLSPVSPFPPPPLLFINSVLWFPHNCVVLFHPFLVFILPLLDSTSFLILQTYIESFIRLVSSSFILSFFIHPFLFHYLTSCLRLLSYYPLPLHLSASCVARKFPWWYFPVCPDASFSLCYFASLVLQAG